MLPVTSETCVKVSNFDFSLLTAAAASTVKESQYRQKEVTQYNLNPVEVRTSHPLIIDSTTACRESVCDMDSESLRLRAELKRLFPQDAQIRKLLLPIVKGEAVTERQRLELEACLKYPHVLDLQEAFVKRELGEELNEFEQLLLWRMDGAVDFEVSNQD